MQRIRFNTVMTLLMCTLVMCTIWLQSTTSVGTDFPQRLRSETSFRNEPGGSGTPCMVELAWYVSIAKPMTYMDLTEYSSDRPLSFSGQNFLFTATGSKSPGYVEYALPECAPPGQFEVRALIKMPQKQGAPCTFSFNTLHQETAHDGWHRLGVAVSPILARSQVAIVIEKLSGNCRIEALQLNAISREQPPSLRPLPAPATFSQRPCWRARSEDVREECDGGDRCAYVTLVLNDRFCVYAYVLYHSLLASGTVMPLVVLCGPSVSDSNMQRLESHGMIVQRVQPFPYPARYRVAESDTETRKSLRFTKLEAWRLTQYRKVVMIDTDTMVLRNIDALFTCPSATAAADQGAPGNFNSGLFVLQPDLKTYNELVRLAPMLISYNMGDQGFLNKAFSDWRLQLHQQLPESYNYFPKWRGATAVFSRTWSDGVHVVHFTDIVKPHNWFLHSTMQASSAPSPLSFMAQHGDVFVRWWALADVYLCEEAAAEGNAIRACNHSVRILRNKKCASMTHAFGEPGIRKSFSVILSHAPWRNREHILTRIVLSLQKVPELHTIFLLIHGELPLRAVLRRAPRPIVEVRQPYDALGNRFGPLRVPTDAVLVMDDDILVDWRDVSHAFGIWQQAQSQLIGTFVRDVEAIDSGHIKYEMESFEPDGSHRETVVLTKFMFVHRHYLYMYSCLLPFQLWDYPNKQLNCEDLLMNLVTSAASALPPVAYQPAFALQSDYGAPVTPRMNSVLLSTNAKVHTLSGLSGDNESSWHDDRVACTRHLVHEFENTGLFRPIKLHAMAPFSRIWYERRYITEAGSDVVDDTSLGSSPKRIARVQGIHKNIGEEFLLGKKRRAILENRSPAVLPGPNCPERADVLNTPRSTRWTIWNDPNCSDGCALKRCNFGTLAPCCVRRLIPRWPGTVGCEDRPMGCGPFEDHVIDQKHRLPTVMRSLECPSRAEVIDTMPLARASIWEDVNCTDGCSLPLCAHVPITPCCVWRQRATFPVSCRELPSGCTDHRVSSADTVDLRKQHNDTAVGGRSHR